MFSFFTLPELGIVPFAHQGGFGGKAGLWFPSWKMIPRPLSLSALAIEKPRRKGGVGRKEARGRTEGDLERDSRGRASGGKGRGGAWNRSCKLPQYKVGFTSGGTTFSLISLKLLHAHTRVIAPVRG